MLSKQPWMTVREDIHWETRQCMEEGRAVTSDLEAEAKAIKEFAGSPAESEQRARTLSEQLSSLPLRDDFPYLEPDELEKIRELRQAAKSLQSANYALLADKVYGAWLGRCAGCLLGQPIECWMRDRIEGLLKDTGNYPLSDYIRSDIAPEIRDRWNVRDEGLVYGGRQINWINNVAYMPEDDDTNYTILALRLLEIYGPNFTAEDVGEMWLNCLPLLHVCTAERVAYINLCNMILPPNSAQKHNPYREWIGAQIRGDLFGYVCPGHPEKAAEFAWRDARISHVKNGVYGEMFVSAMLAAAAVTDNIPEIIRQGLGQIPKTSRLYHSIVEVITLYERGENVSSAFELVLSRYDERCQHDWCHTISNAMLVTIALLYGEKDFEKTICLAVSMGFDTDCNGATAGSILGLVLGAKALPEKWIAPLHDTIYSGVDGVGKAAISELARRTVALIPKVMNEVEP